MIKLKKYSSEGRKTKLWSDLLMTFSVAAMTITVGLPLSDHDIKWVNFGIGVVGLMGKLLTNVAEFKIKEEETVEEEPNETK